MLKQGNQRGFSRTALADDGGGLSFFYLQIQFFEHFFPRTVTERHVLKRDVTDHVRFKLYLLVVFLLTLQVHDLKQAVGCNQRILNGLVGRYQRADGRDDVADERIEHHQCSRCQFLVDDQHTSHPEHRNGDGCRDELDATLCHDRSVNAAERVLQQMHEAGLRLQVGKVLYAETLDGGDGVDGFHQLCLQVRAALHDTTLVFPVQPIEPPEDKQEKRCGCQRHKGKLPRIHEHQTHREKQDHHVHHQIERHVVDKIPDFHRIVHTRDNLTHTHRIEELLRECQQVLVISQYQGGVDALSGLQCQDALHGSDKGAENQDDNHHHAHQVKQVDVSVH